VIKSGSLRHGGAIYADVFHGDPETLGADVTYSVLASDVRIGRKPFPQSGSAYGPSFSLAGAPKYSAARIPEGRREPQDRNDIVRNLLLEAHLQCAWSGTKETLSLLSRATTDHPSAFNPTSRTRLR
jgi:hypothetical protein